MLNELGELCCSLDTTTFNIKNKVNPQLSSILIACSSSLKEFRLFDCCLTDDSSVILFIAPLDVHEAMDFEQSAPSEEFLGLSESDLMDSLRVCFVREALIDPRIHLERPEVASSFSSIKSDFLKVLQIIYLA